MEIRYFISLMWRRLWLVLLIAIVAGGLVYFVNRQSPAVYAATAVYIIDQAPKGNTGNEYSQTLFEQQLAQSYMRIINTRPVREQTLADLHLEDQLTEMDLAKMVSISAQANTDLITIYVEDTDPVRATAIANTMGFVFIAQNQARENQRYATPIANWEKQLEELAAEIQTTETQINELNEPTTAVAEAELSRLKTNLNELRILYTNAFNKINELQLAQAQESSNLIVIETAIPTYEPIRPRPLLNALLASFIVALLSFAVIFSLDYLDDSIKSPHEILKDTGLATLGMISFLRGANAADALVTARAPRDPMSEAYRMLRTNLDFTAVDGGLKSFLVTSSSPGEGKSTTTANLAVVMAQAGKRVILVDADLRRPIQHKIFNVGNNHGLTTAILDSSSPLTHHLQQSNVPNLQLMSSGPLPPNPADLLDSQRMLQLMSDLQQLADVVLFDTPPVLAVADATILAPRVNGTLLVVENGKTRRAALAQAVERLQNSNTRLLGVLINKLDPRKTGGYGYYYTDSYYHTGEKPDGRGSALKRTGWLPGFKRP